MKQTKGKDLQWVAITQGSPTQVLIKPGETKEGEYVLSLDSFALANPSMILQTDTITLVVKYEFTRDKPLPTAMETTQDKTTNVEMANIKQASVTASAFEVGIRQTLGKQLSWVSIVQEGSITTISLSPSSKVALGEHQLYLESYDLESSDRVTLYQDQVKLIVKAGCNIKAEDAHEVAAVLEQKPVKLSATTGSTSLITASISEQVQLIKDGLKYGSDEEILCGIIKATMSSNHAYLTLNEGLQSIQLDSSHVLTETSITDSFVQVDVDKYSFRINVLVDIFECRVDTLGFEKEFLSTDYTIGLGLHQVSLPEIVQKPDCGKSINGLKIKDIVAKETISGYAKQAIRLDTDIASLLIKTGKFNLAGESIKVIVSI